VAMILQNAQLRLVTKIWWKLGPDVRMFCCLQTDVLLTARWVVLLAYYKLLRTNIVLSN